MLVSQMSFHGETCGGVAKCRLFSQAKSLRKPLLLAFSHLEEVCLHNASGKFPRELSYFYTLNSNSTLNSTNYFQLTVQGNILSPLYY